MATALVDFDPASDLPLRRSSDVFAAMAVYALERGRRQSGDVRIENDRPRARCLWTYGRMVADVYRRTEALLATIKLSLMLLLNTQIEQARAQTGWGTP